MPPFKQGLSLHSSMSISHCVPVKPKKKFKSERIFLDLCENVKKILFNFFFFNKYLNTKGNEIYQI